MDELEELGKKWLEAEESRDKEINSNFKELHEKLIVLTNKLDEIDKALKFHLGNKYLETK